MRSTRSRLRCWVGILATASGVRAFEVVELSIPYPKACRVNQGSRDKLYSFDFRMSLSRNRCTLLLTLTFGSGDML
jgi:hypothetical protein